MASVHQIDVNDVASLDIKEDWFEHGVKEAVWVEIKNPPFNCNSGSRITLSLSWDRFI